MHVFAFDLKFTKGRQMIGSEFIRWLQHSISYRTVLLVCVKTYNWHKWLSWFNVIYTGCLFLLSLVSFYILSSFMLELSYCVWHIYLDKQSVFGFSRLKQRYVNVWLGICLTPYHFNLRLFNKMQDFFVILKCEKSICTIES